MISPSGTGGVRMNLDVTGIYHQPLKIRFIDYFSQQPLPNITVPPKTAMGILPVSVVWV